jgi:hypothetical protein
VVLEHQLRAVGDEQLRRRYAALGEACQLALEQLHVERHARAEHVDLVGAQHSGGEQV